MDNYNVLREVGFKAWAPNRKVEYSLPGCASCTDVRAAIVHLLACGAWDDGSAAISAPSQTAVCSGLEKLQSMGYSRQLASGAWFLRPEIRKALRIAFRLAEPPKALCEPRACLSDLGRDDWANYEMLLKLQTCGWRWYPLPSKKNDQTYKITLLPIEICWSVSGTAGSTAGAPPHVCDTSIGKQWTRSCHQSLSGGAGFLPRQIARQDHKT